MEMDPDPQIIVGANYSMVINGRFVKMYHRSIIQCKTSFMLDEMWDWVVVHGWDRKDVS